MKVFKMLHPNIGDGLIVREIGTLHGVARGGVVPKHNSFIMGLKTMTPKVMIPLTNGLAKKLAWSSRIILNPQ
jgi:hypothetical protein